MPKVNIILLFTIILTLTCMQADLLKQDAAEFTSTNQSFQGEGWKTRAKEMVEDQLQERGINNDRLLKVMENTPRHLFVPSAYRAYAYDDGPLPIGEGQTISQPYVVALMTELLKLEGDEKVLEIGTGSGYQAAILAQLAKEVYTIEIVESLAASSEGLLRRMGYDNVTVKWGDGYQGWTEHAPFDRIILTAAPEKTPPKLIEQLKPGGIMVLPVGSFMQELKIITKRKDGSIRQRKEGFVRFVPMVHPEDSALKKP